MIHGFRSLVGNQTKSRAQRQQIIKDSIFFVSDEMFHDNKTIKLDALPLPAASRWSWDVTWK